MTAIRLDLLPGLSGNAAHDADLQLVRQHAPVIHFDAAEPFLPLVTGFTLFHEAKRSPSFNREISLAANVEVAIEYAIWWDWDIQHLYELEHIWVYLDASGAVVDAEASSHGGFSRMVDADGALSLVDGQVHVCSEPGKHAFAGYAEKLAGRRSGTELSCGPKSGVRGVLVPGMFADHCDAYTPYNNQLAHTYLEQHRFRPTFDFSLEFPLEQTVIVPWEQLAAWIPQRLDQWVRALDATIPYSQRRVMRIAHRGASAHAQENSPDAMRVAAELGSDMVEVDVRLTADGVPVIAHDDSLQRVYGVDGTISGSHFEELQQRVPLMTFENLVKVCREYYLGLYLDIKAISLQAGELMFNVVDQYGYLPYTIFSSFRADWVADIKAARPDAFASVLFGATNVDPVGLAADIDADYVHPCWERRDPKPHTLLTPEWLHGVHDAGLGIVCWHEERPSEIAALMDLGVNGICSDQPELLLEEAQRRNPR